MSAAVPALLVAAAAIIAARLVRVVMNIGRSRGVGLRSVGRQTFGPRNALADQFLDLGDGSAVAWTDDGDGGAGLAGAAGATNAVHVVVGMMRDVEIENMADVRNVEPAGRDVGGDQELDLALAELVERCLENWKCE